MISIKATIPQSMIDKNTVFAIRNLSPNMKYANINDNRKQKLSRRLTTNYKSIDNRFWSIQRLSRGHVINLHKAIQWLL